MSSDLALWVGNKFYTKIVGKLIPARFFGGIVPDKSALQMPAGKPHLEIVCHCWQYAHMLVYQMSSLVNFTPSEVDVTYTLFYAAEDKQTQQLVDTFSGMSVPGITWNWQVLPKASLLRRAIGRNTAALQSTADWLWFTDCDLVYHESCLDSLATFLKTRQTGLIFPAIEMVTGLLDADHPMIDQSLSEPPPVPIDASLFHPSELRRPKGGSQIVHGDVARAAGYCKDVKLYQQPDSRWRKTYEDTVFTNLIGYKAQAIDLPGVYRIRHAAKGRYHEGSSISNIRTRIRKAQDGSTP